MNLSFRLSALCIEQAMKSSYHVSMYERGYFCINYRVHFTILKIKLSIGYTSGRLAKFFFFHFIHQIIKVSEKQFTMFVIKKK